MSTCHEWINSAVALAGLVLGAVSMINSNRTSRRYASGNVPIVNKSLDPARLEKAADVLSSIFREAGGIPADADIGACRLSVQNKEGYAELCDVFHDLNNVCAIIQDDALPPKVKKTAKSLVNDYLSRAQVLCFAKMFEEKYASLQPFVNEVERNWGNRKH